MTEEQQEASETVSWPGGEGPTLVFWHQWGVRQRGDHAGFQADQLDSLSGVRCWWLNQNDRDEDKHRYELSSRRKSKGRLELKCPPYFFLEKASAPALRRFITASDTL